MPDHPVSIEPAMAVEPEGVRIYVEGGSQAGVTPLGPVPFFIEFLKTADLLGPGVPDCPLQTRRRSPSPVGMRRASGFRRE